MRRDSTTKVELAIEVQPISAGSVPAGVVSVLSQGLALVGEAQPLADPALHFGTFSPHFTEPPPSQDLRATKVIS